MATASTKEAQGSNPFGGLINQEFAIVPSFTLESGATLNNIPVAYKTWGKLNERGDNVLILCHALTGSADVEDWYVYLCRCPIYQ
jgi:homoserine O-acetyltransferase